MMSQDEKDFYDHITKLIDLIENIKISEIIGSNPLWLGSPLAPIQGQGKISLPIFKS